MWTLVSSLISRLVVRLRRRRQWYRTATVWIIAIAFLLGNLGFNVTLKGVGQETVSLTASCCCGTASIKCSCCCRAIAAKPAQAVKRACCSSRSAAQESSPAARKSEATGPRLGCSCNLTPQIEFAFSSQPKVVPERAAYVSLEGWENLPTPADLVIPRPADGPETPPPRMSVG